MRAPSITVILPAFNEAGRIEQTLTTVARYQARQPAIRHVFVADDGSSDDTLGVVERTAERLGITVGMLAYPHRGKALSVKAAMLDVAPRVDTEYLMMLDADDELKIDQLDQIEWSVDPKTIYIARRVGEVAGTAGMRPTPIRRTMSWAMRSASRILLGIRFPDTQCGFKLFPRAIVPALFGQQRATGWTFDAELLYIAHRVARIPIREVPVVWSPRGVSRVRPLTAALSGFAMFGTAFNRMRRVYRPLGTIPASGTRPALSEP